MTNKLLDAALEYAAKGWPVFPCAPGEKVPLRGSRGCLDATLDEAKIRAWWAAQPDANVAIATGGTISGLYVVDVDAADFDRSGLPETLIACTPRGGWHYYYSSEEPLPNTTSKLAPGVDTRGVGGYVLAPPSRSASGHAYTWANEVPFQGLPIWIANTVRKTTEHPQVQIILPPREPPPVDGGSAYGLHALREECEAIRCAAEGTRNNVLNTSAFKVWTLVAGGEIAESLAHAELESAALGAGLEPHEIRATLASAFKAGITHPRTRPEQTQVRVTHVRGFDVHTTLTDLEASQVADVPVVAEATKSHLTQDLYTEEERIRSMIDSAAPNATALAYKVADIHAKICQMPGLPGAYLRWTKETARFHQPALEVGSLLALGSMLGARKFSMRGSTTAAYYAALGNTGDGKGHAQGALTTLLQHSWSTLLGPGAFSSSAATVNRIAEATRGGHGIGFIIDEYGPALMGLMDKRALTGYQKDLRGLLLKLATTGTGTYLAPQSLTQGGKDLPLTAPCITIFGSTTPSTFHEALGRVSVDDGFLGRHMVFETNPVLPMRNKRADELRPTTELVEYVKAIREAHEEWNRGMPADVKGPDGNPELSMYETQRVGIDAVADAMLDNLTDEMDAFRRKSDDLIACALSARAAEHTQRTAMILAILCNHRNPVIDETMMSIAQDLVRYSGAIMNGSINMHSASNDFERDRKQVLRILAAKQNGVTDPTDLRAWVTKTHMLRNLRGMKAEQIDSLLERLAQEGAIQISTAVGAGRPTTRYRLSLGGA